MFKYAICEILGKQYKVIPGRVFEIDFASDEKNIEANVLLLVEDGKLKVGKPHLKQKIALKPLGKVMGKKIRVSKYRAKANYRRVLGFRPKFTKVIWET